MSEKVVKGKNNDYICAVRTSCCNKFVAKVKGGTEIYVKCPSCKQWRWEIVKDSEPTR